MAKKSGTQRVSRDQLLEWVERVAEYLAQDGMPPIAGRILGWLMACDPPEQSASEIAEAIGASRASITTNMQVLGAMGFIHRRTRPGSRTEYFRLEPGAWETVVRRQVAGLVAFGRIARDGLALTGKGPRGARLEEAQEIFAWLQRVFDEAAPPPSGRPIISKHDG